MKLNVAERKEKIYTHGGAEATRTDAFHELRRSVLTALLWEPLHYETGSEVAERVAALVPKVKPEQVAVLACEARDRMQLRHMPLYLVSELSKVKGTGPLVADTLEHVIQRADELGELLAIYWANGKHPLSAGVKRGLARAFTKFSEYALAKYNRDSKVKLKDALFLCHAKPKDAEQAELWKRLIAGKLETPNTWEVALSAGKSKRETFERMITEGSLGGMALLRNLRNMVQAGCDLQIVRDRLKLGAARALPFRFIAAAKHAPKLEDAIGEAMLVSAGTLDKLAGRTLLVIDISGSMRSSMSGKSEMNRIDAACGLAILVREVCESATIYATAGDDSARKHATAEVPARRGFALSDAINGLYSKLGGGGIFLAQVMDYISEKETDPAFDRVIVITDEQDCDTMRKPTSARRLGKFNYILNVAPHKNGIGYQNGWNQIDGWSEQVIAYVSEFERMEQDGQT